MDGNTQTEYNMVSQLALRVALQTMKERCLSLQQRLSVVEEENDNLRSRLDSDQQQSDNCSSLLQNKSTSHNSMELDNLRSQVSELNRQKVQLSDHINMVATENRKLWSRLSQIAKEQEGSNADQTKNENELNPHSTSDELDSPKANQNLVRSRTFTQHSPNPKLRLKVVTNENPERETEEDPSLEEVLLVESSVSDEEEGSIRELKSNEIIGVCETELGFTYLNVHAPDDDFNIEAKKCLEGLHKIRLEVMHQQLEMSSTLETLENRFVLQRCEVCAKKPEMIDKSLDTDDIIFKMPEFLHIHDEECDEVEDEECDEVEEEECDEVEGEDCDEVEDEECDDDDHDHEDNAQALPSHIDFIQRKLEADKKVKICPMCGQSFGPTITFDQFVSHVESHFLQDSSSDSEQNYEFIAHTVGDF